MMFLVVVRLGVVLSMFVGFPSCNKSLEPSFVLVGLCKLLLQVLDLLLVVFMVVRVRLVRVVFLRSLKPFNESFKLKFVSLLFFLVLSVRVLPMVML